MIKSVNTDLLSHGPLEVRILKIESPSLFWVQLTACRHFPEILEELNWKMPRRHTWYFLRPDHVKKGLLVTIKDRQRWHRGIVTKVKNFKATVFLGDEGRRVRLDTNRLYSLPPEFHKDRWAAIPCGLRSLRPVDAGTMWSRETTDLFRVLAEGKTGTIRIRKSIGGVAAYVDLTVPRTWDSYSGRVGETLIALGYADEGAEEVSSTPPAAGADSIIKATGQRRAG